MFPLACQDSEYLRSVNQATGKKNSYLDDPGDELLDQARRFSIGRDRDRNSRSLGTTCWRVSIEGVVQETSRFDPRSQIPFIGFRALQGWGRSREYTGRDLLDVVEDAEKRP